MLCEIMNESSFGFVETWALLTVAAWISLLITSGAPFYYYYHHPTYEKWLVKTNRNYPAPWMIRNEAYKSLKGCIFVTLSPTLALYLAKLGLHSKAYCGLKYGVGYEILQFAIVFLLTDFFEWGWHWMGHRYDVLWEIHRPHHVFYNPSPFAVIADDAPDEIARGSPLFLIPMLMPTNLELLFLQYIIFFNIYGTMIHTGIDFAWLTPHGQHIINTPYHHHLHHAISTKNKPLHTGFFLQVWDRYLGNSIYHGNRCLCSVCDAKAGNRTREAFDKLHKPDYSVLLQPSFWFGEWNEESNGKAE